MKKIILTSAITIAIVIASAQVTSPNQTQSSKELMKMEVVKIDPARANSYELATVINSSLSQKEAMKANVVGNSFGVIQINNTNNTSDCPSCLALSKLASKEQMKAQVIGLYKCSSDYNIISNNTTKCRFCGMRLTAKN